MATQPQTGRGSQASASNKGKTNASAVKAPPPKAAAAAAAETSTSDHVYGVVSVLYHALQGAETYSQYIEDAREAGDDELTTFFEECRDEEKNRAARAKTLLAARLEGDVEDEDEDEDEDDDDEEDEEEE